MKRKRAAWEEAAFIVHDADHRKPPKQRAKLKKEAVRKE